MQPFQRGDDRAVNDLVRLGSPQAVEPHFGGRVLDAVHHLPDFPLNQVVPPQQFLCVVGEEAAERSDWRSASACSVAFRNRARNCCCLSRISRKSSVPGNDAERQRPRMRSLQPPYSNRQSPRPLCSPCPPDELERFQVPFVSPVERRLQRSVSCHREGPGAEVAGLLDAPPPAVRRRADDWGPILNARAVRATVKSSRTATLKGIIADGVILAPTPLCVRVTLGGRSSLKPIAIGSRPRGQAANRGRPCPLSTAAAPWCSHFARNVCSSMRSNLARGPLRNCRDIERRDGHVGRERQFGAVCFKSRTFPSSPVNE